jgi:cation:H+ antiporter
VSYAQILGGILLLFVGGEALVRGAVSIARRLGVSPLVIGLTVVALGTSAPEFVVSVNAALSGRSELAVANVVGSNIANIALILGLACVIRPIAFDREDIRPDMLAMLGAFALLVALSLLGTIGRLAGTVMVGLLLAYLARTYVRERTASAQRAAAVAAAPATPPAAAAIVGEGCDLAPQDWHEEEAGEYEPVGNLALAAVLIGGGLVALVFGADFLVKGATTVAEQLGVPATVIGLTVVALGTSLPELTTSVIASARCHADVAVGNVLGSNVFNVLLILGLTAMISPIAIPSEIARFDVWVMLAAGAVTAFLVLVRGRIGRLAGSALFVAYIAYVVFLYAR